MQDLTLVFQLTLLLIVANGTPILARNILHAYAAWPVDGGRNFPDGRRLLGDTKTWRGLVFSVAVTMLVALPLGYPMHTAVLFALLSMSGDLLSSFLKRRLGMAPSSRAAGLDQLPEAVLPLWILHRQLSLDWLDGVAVVTLFVVIEVWLSKLLYRWHIRQRPY